MKTELIRLLNDKAAKVGVIGLGYVGLPLLLGFAEAGFEVTGIDLDERKLSALREGRSYLKHIPDSRIAEAARSGRVKGATTATEAGDLDAYIICVPTPLGGHLEPDISYIVSSIEAIVPNLRKGQIISLESTTYPGTTDEEIVTRVEKAGFKVGEDVFVVFSPEREDPGNEKYSTQTIPKVCGGVTPACLEVGLALYQSVITRVVPVSSARAAEMTKLLENIHRAVNIGLVNELKIVADAMDIDIYEVIKAAATKPFGFVPYWPGPGLGGHCIPIDPFYLTWKAREFGVKTKFIELAGEVNTAMPHYVVSKVGTALNGVGRAMNGAKILVLGVAYKKNVEDPRESPAIEIVHELQETGAVVRYSDPHIPSFQFGKSGEESASMPISAETLKSVDCVVLVTDHDGFDYDLIAANAPLIVDTRGRFPRSQANVLRA